MSQRFVVEYTNWRGENSKRIFAGYEMFWGSNEYHPTPQWFIKGFDLKKKEWRDFAVKDMKPWEGEQ